MTVARVRVLGVELFERDVPMRLPFKFGAVTLHNAVEAHLRARVEVDGQTAYGVTAEVLAPKWFDKARHLSNDDNVDQLRRSIGGAASAYIDAGPGSPFGLHADCYQPVLEAGGREGLPPLAAAFGLAELDKAVVDAVCKARGVDGASLIAANGIGLDARLTPDLAGVDIDRFLASLSPLDRVQARHTVGMIDPLTVADLGAGDRPEDGLPVTLEEIIAAYGHRYFKLKVGGDVDQDVERLRAIADVLDRVGGDDYVVSIDGNEQYADADGVVALLDGLDDTPGLDRFRASIRYLEQPIDRDVSYDTDVSAIARRVPMVVDESDGTIDAFPHHAELGYRGVSAKSCKGLYKAFLNRVRCAAWNARDGGEDWFMTAEDLTLQAGVGVQQDLALVATLGIDHVERNGHHYGPGMRFFPAPEATRFLETHGDLYRVVDGVGRLRIHGGFISTGGLRRHPGLGGSVTSDVASMRATASYGDPG